MIAVEDVVRGLWQALSRRDWEALKTFLSDDCLYVDMPVPALSARGPEDIVKRLRMGLEQLAGYENHTGVLVSNGSDVLYEHSETWTFATGEQGVLRFVTVHKVVDGKVTVWKDYWDFNSLVAFAPPNHFEGLATGDVSWVFDASALV
ncbi:nuclear transport factor 2 family protein [Mycobacterium sp. MUNTM1]